MIRHFRPELERRIAERRSGVTPIREAAAEWGHTPLCPH
jgi:hypothetical protein